MSGEMLADSGIKWTLTGHSERRVGFGYPGETSKVHLPAFLRFMRIASHVRF
jgi:triosephosphate isomerase